MSDNLDTPLPERVAPPRAAAPPQLLIDMPAETAARLLVRSLVDQVCQLDPALTRPEEWRVAATRLAASLALYADVLGDSATRKGRRRARRLANQANRTLGDARQVAWLDANRNEEDVKAAQWMAQRILRRQPDREESLARIGRDTAKLRRLGKSMSVYTKAVRLDDMPLPRSFAVFTRDLATRYTNRLRKDVDAIRLDRPRSARRALERGRRLGHLLEPLRVHIEGVAGVREQLVALEQSLERLADLGSIATSLVRAARRAGGDEMTLAIRTELFAGADDADQAKNTHIDLRPGLLGLAHRLSEDTKTELTRFKDRWNAGELDAMLASVDACTARLA